MQRVALSPLGGDGRDRRCLPICSHSAPPRIIRLHSAVSCPKSDASTEGEMIARGMAVVDAVPKSTGKRCLAGEMQHRAGCGPQVQTDDGDRGMPRADRDHHCASAFGRPREWLLRPAPAREGRSGASWRCSPTPAVDVGGGAGCFGEGSASYPMGYKPHCHHRDGPQISLPVSSIPHVLSIFI